MSRTNAPMTPASTAARPVPAPAGPRERRVRFGHLALAIALVVVGALGTVTLVTVVSADGDYLAVARDVEYGAQFSEADLVTVRINNPPGISPVRARDKKSVVGNFATMPLAAGTLLTPAHVTDASGREPGPREVRLGITLRNERLPGSPVVPGHQVLLVDTSSQRGGEDGPPPPTRTWQAIVVGVSGDGPGGILRGSRSQETTIDVIVAAADGPAIATLAAANELSVAVLPGQPGAD